MLFHCTREACSPGSVLGPYESSHFSERLRKEGKEWVDLVLGECQPPHQSCSRTNAVYAADSAANAAIFLDGQNFQDELQAHLRHNVQTAVPTRYCYEVQPELTSVAPMALIRSLELAKKDSQKLKQIAVEYWSPLSKWNYWEFFAPCMIVVRLVEWPSGADIQRAKSLYQMDRQTARGMFGC
jgi:hypothetical protein